MTRHIDAINRLAEAWTTLAVAALWQGALVAVVAALAAYVLRRSSPAVRYWVWQIVAIKLLLLPFWGWSIGLAWLPAQPPAPIEPEVAGTRAPRTPTTDVMPVTATTPSPAPLTRAPEAPAPVSLADLSWQSWLVLVWATLVAAQLARLGLLGGRLSRLLRTTQPGGGALVGAVEHAAAELGVKRRPRVRVAALDGSPFVCGILRPTVVLPQPMLDVLECDDLHQVLLHELAHLKRRDLVWGWLPELARVLYFFHPAVHWAYGRIRLERELACDQVAMAKSGRRPAEYAAALVRVLSTNPPGPTLLPAAAPLDGGQAVGPTSEEQP